MGDWSAQSAPEVVRRLGAGGVLLMATDTLPGLHCRIDQPQALRRISRLKGRAEGKPLVVLAGSVAQAQQVTAPLTPIQLAICEGHWPGPFSFVLPVGRGIDPLVTGGKETVAIRVPANDPLRTLILAVGVPLVSTSANVAGQTPAATMAEAVRNFGDAVDGVWGDEIRTAELGEPSAVVDLTVTPFKVLRPGPQAFVPA